MNLFKKSILIILFAAFLSPIMALGATSKVHIICYHSFNDRKDGISFSYDKLRRQLKMLKKKGYRFVSFQDVVEKRIKGSMNILVTVDDGNKSVLKAYKEVFKPMGIKPILAIYPNIIGKMRYALTWKQLKYLSREGCEIAAHGYFHLFVNKKLYNKNRRYFKLEIYRSKRVLEKKLGRKITLFLYPFGARSKITIKHLKIAGYKYAMTIDGRSFNVPRRSISGLYEIPRYYMTQRGWKSAFARIFRRSNSTAIAFLPSFTKKDRRVNRRENNISDYYSDKKSKNIIDNTMIAGMDNKKGVKKKTLPKKYLLDPPKRSKRFIRLKAKYKEMEKDTNKYYGLWLIIIHKRLKDLTLKASKALPRKKSQSK